MFREMRRKRQALSKEACEQILKDGKTGVLALLGDDDYPYTVPLNYCYENGKLYFHCAKSGHKIDAVKKCAQASFCVIAGSAFTISATATISEIIRFAFLLTDESLTSLAKKATGLTMHRNV